MHTHIVISFIVFALVLVFGFIVLCYFDIVYHFEKGHEIEDKNHD